MKDFLRQVSIFSELNDEELDLLVESITEKHYDKDSHIVQKGDAGISLFIVRSGEVEAIIEKDSGEYISLSTFKSGDFFGEISLFDGKPRSVTVIARKASTVLEISREVFIKQIFKYPEIALRILSEIVTRFRKTDEILKSFSEKVYEYTYEKLEKSIEKELNVASSFYQKAEEKFILNEQRVHSITGSIERNWNFLQKTIWSITGAFFILGIILGWFGWNKVSSLNEMADDAKIKYEKIKNIGELAEQTSIIKHTILHIKNVKDNFMSIIDEGSIDDIEPERLKQLSIIFTPSIETLLGYLDEYEKYEPQVIIEATKVFLRISKHSKLTIKEFDARQIYKSHSSILRNSGNDWRIHLGVNDNLSDLGQMEIDGKIEKDFLIRELNRTLFSNEEDSYYFDHIKHNYVRILIKLGGEENPKKYIHNVKVARELLRKFMNNKKNLWRSYQSAIWLIKIGDENDFESASDDLLNAYNKSPGSQRFLSSLFLSELDKKTLDKISDKKNRSLLSGLNTRLTEQDSFRQLKRSDRYDNEYLRHYAKKIADSIVK
jgi:CRP-like cAMP-binding protein